MKANVSDLPVGTKFNHKGMEYVVVERDYPFATCKCLTEPNDYQGILVQFGGGFDNLVEVPDGAKTYKQTFVDCGKNLFVRKEELS